MTDDEKEWLTNNRDTFFETNIPALQILDFLVTAKVFRPTSDDYQVIVAQTTLVEQIRKLLDALPSKSSAAFQVFSKALKKHCPHVLNACTNRPAEVLEKLDEELRSHFRTIDQEELKSFSWLVDDPDCPPITISNYIRHLAVVGKTRADTMISERVASSAAEDKRCEYLYSNAEKHNLIQLENIFDDLDSGRLSECSDLDTTSTNVAEPPAKRRGRCCRPRARRSPFLV